MVGTGYARDYRERVIERYYFPQAQSPGLELTPPPNT